MKEYNYKNYWDFLKQTPKNLWSIISIWIVAGIIIGGALSQPSYTFDPEWSKYGIIGFMIVVMVLAYLRPYTIYNKLKNK